MKRDQKSYFQKKKKSLFLPASESGEARLAAPSVPTKTPLALPARLTQSAHLPSASAHTYTHQAQAMYISANTTDTAITWRIQQNTHTLESFKLARPFHSGPGTNISAGFMDSNDNVSYVRRYDVEQRSYRKPCIVLRGSSVYVGVMWGGGGGR